MDRRKATIFVFCNSCAPQWHSAVAIAADGTGLTGHVCSGHAWFDHDMGFSSNWKHDVYDKHYPEGWELEYVETTAIANHERLQKAFKLHRAMQEGEVELMLAGEGGE